MSHILTNYTGGRSNWGCQATSIGLLNFLQDECIPVENTISTVPLPRGHDLDKLHEITYGNQIRDIYSKEEPTHRDLDLIDRLVQERFGDYYYQVRDADIVFFQGEGSIGPSNYLRNTRLYGLPFLASRKWKKNVIALNLTLYAANESDRRVLGSLFQGFRLVAVREAASYAYGKEMGLSVNLVCCPDMAFRSARTILTGSAHDIGTDYFCVSGSALLNKLDSRMIARTVEQIALKTGLEPVFVHSREKDWDGLGGYLKSFRNVSGTAISDHNDLLPILAKSRFVFGGRYHTAVSALSQTTPIILLPGNNFKSEGLADLVDIDFRVFSPSDIHAILDAAQDLVHQNSEYRSRIENALRKLSIMHVEFSDLVRAILDSETIEVDQFKTLHPIVRWSHRKQFDGLYSKYNRSKRPFAFFGRRNLEKLRQKPDFTDHIAKTFTHLP